MESTSIEKKKKKLVTLCNFMESLKINLKLFFFTLLFLINLCKKI